MIEPARGGEVGLKYGADYPAFAPANPRSACNTRRVASTMLSYRARRDYTGADTFVIEVVSPDGVARQIRYSLTVR